MWKLKAFCKSPGFALGFPVELLLDVISVPGQNTLSTFCSLRTLPTPDAPAKMNTKSPLSLETQTSEKPEDCQNQSCSEHPS